LSDNPQILMPLIADCDFEVTNLTSRQKEFQLAIGRHSHNGQEEQKDVVGVPLDFNSESGIVRNRVGDQIPSTPGDRGEE
jgi:hypothetical protein